MLSEVPEDAEPGSASIVVLDRFIQATRDSGYKSTASAIAELVDNSLQAGARRIIVHIVPTGSDDRHPLEVMVVDDGHGMSAMVLREALRFGGTSRFNDRSGLGRYGMGLPNSSLSQARRLSVYSWETPSSVFRTYLDVDEVVTGGMVTVPVPVPCATTPTEPLGPHGTIVAWTKCDRLDSRRTSTLERKLIADLGKRFRYFLWGGVSISINGTRVEPLDPLFLHPRALYRGADRFGDSREFEVRTDPIGGSTTGTVRVTFSELPVHEWADLSNKEKRLRGISKGAGVSIVRADREVDYGWFFMGTKRKENYDDWWRCEIRFEPVLDEAFGITHTKQQIRPKSFLVEALGSELENTAHALNARVRKAHSATKTSERFRDSEIRARERDTLLKPLPHPKSPLGPTVLESLKRRHPSLRRAPDSAGGLTYMIVEDTLGETPFYQYLLENGRLVLVLNPEHPFYREVYAPLCGSEVPHDKLVRSQLELILLAAARSEAAESNPKMRAALARHRERWSHALAAFVNA